MNSWILVFAIVNPAHGGVAIDHIYYPSQRECLIAQAELVKLKNMDGFERSNGVYLAIACVGKP